MENRKIIVISFAVSILSTLIGAFFKIMHWEYASEILVFGLLLSLIYIVMSLVEIFDSKKVDGLEKFMWLIGFIFISQITGFVYIILGRKRIIRN